jgi:hypothetical protein
MVTDRCRLMTLETQAGILSFVLRPYTAIEHGLDDPGRNSEATPQLSTNNGCLYGKGFPSSVDLTTGAEREPITAS